MWPVRELLFCRNKIYEMVEESIFQIARTMHYQCNCVILSVNLAKKWQVHKLFPIQPVHKLVQRWYSFPCCWKKNNALINQGWKENIFWKAYIVNANGVRFVDTKKGPIRNKKTPKHPIIVKNVRNLYVKNILSYFTQEVKY